MSRPAARTAPARLRPSTAAWIAVLPCALITVALVAAVGPPLGHALLEPSGTTFWTGAMPLVIPEPVEHARYLLALLGPLMLSGAVVLLVRRTPRRHSAMRQLAGVGELALVAFLAACLIAQQLLVYGHFYYEPPGHRVYFTPATIAVAALLALLAAAALRRRELVARVTRLTRETRARRIAALGMALLAIAVWLLTAVNTEGSIGRANFLVFVNVPLWLDETFSVLNHRFPLVHFNAQYSQLWPYLSAAAMSVFGTSFGVFCAVMVLGSGATMLAVYALLRRIARGSIAALGLFLPVLATSFFTEIGPPADRYAPSNITSLFPMRYGGPYVLAWLTARQLDGARPRARWLLFAAGGLVAINNAEFGAPALAATLAALLWTGAGWTPRSLARLAGELAAGLLAAAASVALLTLVLAGSLPHFGTALTFARLFGIDGYGMLPMPLLGLHLAIYTTFAAALAVATVRTVGGERDALTGLLAWSGVFGLGASAYYAGRSHPEVLISVFSAWSLTLALLVVVVVRAILARPAGWPRAAEIAVLLGFGLAACTLAQTPAPWTQLDRLGRRTSIPALRSVGEERYVAAATRPGEAIAILGPLGHRVAYDIGRVDVTPYGGLDAMPAERQLGETLDALRRADGTKVFVSLAHIRQEEAEALRQAGFALVRRSQPIGLAELALNGG